MKALVLGASGGCGRWLVRLASERGHQVRALVRPATDFDTQANVEVMRGEVLDPSTLEAALSGVDVVFSCLGHRRGGASPWAPLRSPADLMERVARILTTAMPKQGVRRLVAISAGGVGESFEQLSRPVQWLVCSGQIGVAYLDLEAFEEVLSESDLDWLVVRPVTLVNGPPTGEAGAVDRYGITSTVRRADVAAWMLSAAEQEPPFRPRTVLLGTPA